MLSIKDYQPALRGRSKMDEKHIEKIIRYHWAKGVILGMSIGIITSMLVVFIASFFIK